jgi:hypothetical protein
MNGVMRRTAMAEWKLALVLELMRLEDPEVAVTTVKVEENQLMCRLYSVRESAAEIKLDTIGSHTALLRSLEGEPIDRLDPFQIGRVEISPHQ